MRLENGDKGHQGSRVEEEGAKGRYFFAVF